MLTNKKIQKLESGGKVGSVSALPSSPKAHSEQVKTSRPTPKPDKGLEFETYIVAVKREIEKLIVDSSNTINSLWSSMEEVSKEVKLGKVEEDGSIEMKGYDNVTEHDREHISQICERKRYIKELENILIFIRKKMIALEFGGEVPVNTPCRKVADIPTEHGLQAGTPKPVRCRMKGTKGNGMSFVMLRTPKPGTLEIKSVKVIDTPKRSWLGGKYE